MKESREGFPQGESSFFVQRDGRQKKRHETSKRNLEAESISSRVESMEKCVMLNTSTAESVDLALNTLQACVSQVHFVLIRSSGKP